jgi:hypothetical protein
MNLNKKIFISNLIIFLIILFSYYHIFGYLNKINNEISYKNYLKEKEAPLLIGEKEPQTEKLKLGIEMYLLNSLLLILILNNLYYLMKQNKTIK